MWRLSAFLLATLGVATFSGCGGTSSPVRPPTAEQERLMAEKSKQVEAEERQHQEQQRRAATNLPRR